MTVLRAGNASCRRERLRLVGAVGTTITEDRQRYVAQMKNDRCDGITLRNRHNRTIEVHPSRSARVSNALGAGL